MSKDTVIKASQFFEGNHAQMISALEVSYQTNIPIMFHGTMGIGKTKGIEMFARKKAKELGLEFSDKWEDLQSPDVEKKYMFLPIILPLWDIAELKGLPFPNEDRTKMSLLPPSLLPTKGQGIIFFDEMNAAPPAVQTNAYQFFLGGFIGQYRVPEGYMRIAAGNLEDDYGNTYEMPHPLANRLMHFKLNVPKVESWVNNYALPNGLDNRVVNFLLSQRTYFYTHTDDADQLVIATPRMWDYVAQIIEGDANKDSLYMKVAMAVGPAIATAFIAWYELIGAYNIPKIFKMKKPTIDLPEEGDAGKLYALVSGLVSYFLDYPTEENLRILADLSFKFEREHQFLIIKQVVQKDSKYFDMLFSLDDELSKKLMDIGIELM
jgi:hypothetical protein